VSFPRKLRIQSLGFGFRVEHGVTLFWHWYEWNDTLWKAWYQ